MASIVEQLLLMKARKLSPRQKALRLPKPNKPRIPLDIERKYYNDIYKLAIQMLEKITMETIYPRIIDILDEAKTDLLRNDSATRNDNYGRSIDVLFNTMRLQYARNFNDDDIDQLVRKYANEGESFNRQGIKATFEKVLGLNPIYSEPYLQPVMKQFIDENTNLIKSIGNQFFDQVQSDTYRHIQVGVYNKEYAKKIKSEYENEFRKQYEKGILKRRVHNANARARLIARDQISKYNGQLNQTRQMALGITKYKWITAGDERVRDSHAKLDGKIFSWDNPPSINGRNLHPGQDYQCRCNALAVFDEGVTENQHLLMLLNS